MRRWIPVRLCLFFVFAAVGGLALICWTAPSHCITREMHEKIQKGMSLAEVEAIFGCSPGYHSSGPVWIDLGGTSPDGSWFLHENLGDFAKFAVDLDSEANLQSHWVTANGAVHIVCDAETRVRFSCFYSVEPLTALARFELWLLKRQS
jgi:hypothetical protein